MYVVITNRVLGPSPKTSVSAAAKKFAQLHLISQGVNPLENKNVGSVPIVQKPSQKMDLGEFTPDQEIILIENFSRLGNTPAFEEALKSFRAKRSEALTKLGFDPTKSSFVFDDSLRESYRKLMSGSRFAFKQLNVKAVVPGNKDKGISEKVVSTRSVYCLPNEVNTILGQIKSMLPGTNPEQDKRTVEKLVKTSAIDEMINLLTKVGK